ncbi:MAG: hypothetical protein WCA32_02380 [Chromatiaceae bacterium]
MSPERAAAQSIKAEIGESTDEVLARAGVDLDPAAICFNGRCKFVEREPYILQKARCAAADLVVTTHAALLLDWRTGGRLIDTQAFNVIVIDEADRLPSAASLQLDASVSNADLAFLKHAVGLEAFHPASAVIEPRRHGTMSFHLADRSVPVPFDDEVRGDNAEWLQYVASGVRAASEDSERVLVLTTSFATGLAIASRLDDLPVIVHQSGERLQAALSRYSSGIFISPAAWEAVDTDQCWQDIVIPRMLYPRRDGVLDLHFLTAQAQAARRLTQGLARALRRPDQECHAWILDPRFPLPATIVNRGEATQQAAAHHARLIEAIPERFRHGLRATFEKAEIFRSGR